MKKTTKFLLALAASAVMTIGAVSTVMAADQVVSAWGGDYEKGWTATDANGTKITRGWAEDPATGRWYYFVDGVMARNRFVRTNNKTYFVGDDGAMCTGWNKFNKDMKVNYNGAQYDNVAAAFATDQFIGGKNIKAFTKDTQYATVWMYFGTDGVMVSKDWVKDPSDGLDYYMDGPFCLLSEYHYNIPDNKGNAKYFGFSENGNVLSGWIAVPKEETTGADVAGPNGSSKETKTDYVWTYYGAGAVQAPLGWLNIDGDWFYMVDDEKTAKTDAGVVALTNTCLVDTTDDEKTYYYYFNENGYMVKNDSITFTAGDKKDKEITVRMRTDATPDNPATGTAITVAKKTSMTLSFNENGALLTGIQGDMYYEDQVDTTKIYKITVEVKDGNITVYAKEEAEKNLGQLYTGNFIMVDKDGVVRYFDNGLMVKSDAIALGDKVLAFDKDGKLVGKDAVEIGGVKYISSLNYDTDSKTEGVQAKPEKMDLLVGEEMKKIDVYYSVVTK